MRPVYADLKSEGADLRVWRAPRARETKFSGTQWVRTDWGPGKADLRPNRADLRPGRAPKRTKSCRKQSVGTG